MLGSMTTLPGTRYDEYGFVVGNKGPRPEVTKGAAILAIGGALFIVAALLPWYKNGDVSLNGMDTFVNVDGNEFVNPGLSWLIIGSVLLVLAGVSYVRKRYLGVAIAAVVISVIGVFASLLGVGCAQSQRDFSAGGDATYGAYIGIVSMLVAVAGSVQILSKRRAA